MSEPDSEQSSRFVDLVTRARQLPKQVRDARKAIADSVENLYNASEIIPENHPSQIVPIVAELCAKRGIQPPPQLRSSAAFPGGGMALATKNTIIFGEMFGLSQSPSVLKGLSAHEIAHIIFHDEGQSVRKKEARADRFSHFLTGDSSGFIEYLRQQEEWRQLEVNALKQWGWKAKPFLFTKEMHQKKAYGSLESRIENLIKPMMSYEIEDFTKAIAAYNTRIANGGLRALRSL